MYCDGLYQGTTEQVNYYLKMLSIKVLISVNLVASIPYRPVGYKSLEPHNTLNWGTDLSVYS